MRRKFWQVALVMLLAVTSQAYAQSADKSRFKDLGNGALLDTKTNLQWTRHDNGEAINGRDAATFCENLKVAGGRWRLPEITELETIYSLGFEQQCYSYAGKAYTCKVHPSLQLTGMAAWSSTRSPYDPKDGRLFNFTLYLDEGRRVSISVSDNPYTIPFARALCVRST